MASQANRKIASAVVREDADQKQRLLDRAFALAFKGLVYAQIWEDPVVDMEALAIEPGNRIATIASGGCNVFSYLTADPGEIVAVDLNTAHVALNHLKRTAIERLPDHASLRRFFGDADSKANIADYQHYIAPHLDAVSRAYWEGRDLAGRRRIGGFARGVYRRGLLGSFIGLAHLAARLNGVDPRVLLTAKSVAEQRSIFDAKFAPFFDRGFIRWVTAQRSSLFGLGIPPAQYDALAGGKPMADVLRARLEKLACDFPLALCIPRRAGLDERRAACRVMDRGHAHRAAGRARAVPHCGRTQPAAGPPARRSAAPLGLSGRGFSRLRAPRPLGDIWRCASLCASGRWHMSSHGALMDRVYRGQRHIYDATRKYYLLGRDALIADLAPPAGGSVLEIGCGTGRNLIAVGRAWPEAELFGIDISAAMLEKADASLAKAGIAASLVRGDACDFDPVALFGRPTFDRVFISYALSMIPDWRAALAQAARCVAPGGRLEIVDFGQQDELPGLWRRLLFGWLSHFHVAPRADLPIAIASLAGEADAARVSCDRLYRGYAIRAGLARR